MKTHKLLLVLSFVFVAGCENTVDTADWPEYKELLVITANVQHSRNDSLFVHVNVRKTLPAWETFSIQRSLITDATVTLEFGGTTYPVPLVDQAHANYEAILPCASLPDKCTIQVSRNGKHVASQVAFVQEETVPHKVVTVSDDEYSLGVLFDKLNIPGLSYRVVTFFRYSPDDPWISKSSGVFIEGDNYWEYTPISEKTIRYKLTIDPREPVVYVRARVDVLSAEYREYDNALWRPYADGDFFDDPDKDPAFNITGDGIGFFYSIAQGELKEFVWHK